MTGGGSAGPATPPWRERLADYSIWGYAFGYFACYVPYSYLTKVLSSGNLASLDGRSLSGVSLLPISVAASALSMLVFLTAMGWWRYAHHSRVLGLSIPHPTRWTFLSGLCTALIIASTTLAYTFEGISIVFAMLLMRGGLLVMAPLVDAITRRHVRWFSWAALLCAMLALLVGLVDTRHYSLTLLAVLDIAVYLAAYFVRLRFMSRLAKAKDPHTNRRYFVEEQMTAAPMLLVMLVLVLLLGGEGRLAAALHVGFSAYWAEPFLWAIIVLGVFSQGNGVFGSLIFLDRRENSFCVPVNRSSSVLAGIVASLWVATHAGQSPPSASQFVGAAIIILAILFLSIPPWLEARRRTRAAA
jgi:hypothetical protein